MGTHDKLNVDNRHERKRKHNERAIEETLTLLEEWAKHITIISWLPLDMKMPLDEYLVKFKIDEPMTPKEFLKMLVDKVGGELIV